MEITSEVFEVGGGYLTSPEDAAIYLVKFGEESALVDAGCGRATEKLFENIRKCGIDPDGIKYLLITHCHYDHTGGGAELQRRIGLETVAHRLDAKFIESGDDTVTAANWYGAKMKPFRIDRKLAGPREDILLGGGKIQALHAPGHSPGSVVYLTESDGLKVLFGQDVHGPLDPGFRSNEKDYRKSLQMLLDLDADILCEGHFGVYRGKAEVLAFIRQFLR